MDEGIAQIIVSLVGLFGVLYVARQNSKQGKKIEDVHRQTNTNHHSSKDPTILDRLDNIEGLFKDHIDWHRNVK